MQEERLLPDAQPCPNCGDPRPGNFCPACGQRRVERRVSLRRLIADAVEDQFSLNAALPRTLGTIMVHPGRLTTEYLGGRIARFIPPFRLYLLSSFVFFLLLAVTGGGPGNGSIVQIGTEPPDSAEIAAALREAGIDPNLVGPGADSAAARTLRLRRIPQDSAESMADSIMASADWIPNRFRGRVRALMVATLSGDERMSSRLRDEFLSRAPIAIFVLVPVFAALLALVYLRRRRYYVEHFVFALHLHSFAFLLFSALLLLQWIPTLEVLLFIWLAVYLVVALRRVYGQSVPKTLLKSVVLGFSYLLLLSLTLAATMIVSLLLIPV